MSAPDAADVLAGLHATTRADDATRLAKQLKAAAAWFVFFAAALSTPAVIVAVAIGARR